MTTTKKLIGRLPILLGEYDSTKTYSKRQRVTLYGSEFESKVDNNTTAPATLRNGTLIINTDNWRVVSNGTGAFLAGEKLDKFSIQENPEFVNVETDSDGKLIESTDTKGNKTVYGNLNVEGDINSRSISKQINDTIKNKVDKEEGKILIDENIADNFEEEENPEYIAANVDAANKVLDSVDSYGNVTHNTRHIFKGGIEADTSELAKALKKGGYSFSTTDWSNYVSNNGDYPLHLPEPRCAYLNVITTDGLNRLGTIDNQIAIVEYWDKLGNYFKKPAILNQQGDSSRAQWKRNFELNLFDKEVNGDTFAIAFGKWVSQDSFHVKAYYEDIIKGVNIIGYQICNNIALSRGPLSDRPYKDYYTPSNTDTGTNNHDKDILNDARTISDGFPIIIYLNNEFYGIFVLSLKKHRDNYNLNRNNPLNIHLDGYLNEIAFWNNNISWAGFEIRNPKPKKWTLLCQDGSTYSGDNPNELMGEDAKGYDNTNISCVNSAKTKKAIVGLSKYLSEIKSFEDAYNSDKTDSSLSALKTEIEKRFGVSQLIDFAIAINITQDTDIVKNWQWITWGENNGTVKFYVCPWDMDGIFGISSVSGFSITDVWSPTYGRTGMGPLSLIFTYYADDIATRYKELRDKGIISYEKISSMIMDWVNRVGQDNYKLEYEKWNESPCHRAQNISQKWELQLNGHVTFWNDTDSYDSNRTYAKDAYVKVAHVLYQSLQDNNKGNAVTNESYWRRVSYKEGDLFSKGDTVFDGYSSFYLFKAKENTSERPFTKIYNHYPFEGGTYDSALRICAWIKAKIQVADNYFNYKK